MSKVTASQPPSGPGGAPGEAEEPHHSPNGGEGEVSFERIRKALIERPKFSIRMQIYVSLISSFVVILGIVVAELTAIRMMEGKIHFLDIANDYLFEVQQARRFEKNYFLYGTNLADALEHVLLAKEDLRKEAAQFKAVVGQDAFDVMLPHLDEYIALLENLASMELHPYAREFDSQKRAAELEVRTHGQSIVSFAQDLVLKEKRALEQSIHRSRIVDFYSFVLLFLVILFNTYVLSRRILTPINRFVRYTERIAAGDHSRIAPARRYRDEFSDLAMAINLMLEELELRQEVLVQSHKLKAVGTLIAGVAHELNNPINNITLTAHMHLEDYSTLPDDERRELIEDVIHEAGRCKKIVANLLDFARESETRMEVLDLGPVVRETLELAANQITLKGARVDSNIEPDLPRIRADKQQLCQVFLNLILNALHVTDKGGRIEVDAGHAEKSGFLAVRVTDFGPGIPDHIIPSVFDPFFTTKSEHGGTGLGLSVSQGIVTKHGGEISVDSEINAGTTFTVTLPIASSSSISTDPNHIR